MRVLLVEDEAPLRETLAARLKRLCGAGGAVNNQAGGAINGYACTRMVAGRLLSVAE